jgi:cell division initiation protein
MIDLTPLDVRKKKGDFRKKPLGGYDPEEVNNFLDLVEERLEELVMENHTLSDRLSLMEERLKTLEGRENAVQDALVSAQELRREVQDQTQKDAEVLEDQSRREIQLFRKEAESEMERRFMEAESLLKERQMALEELERNRQKFLKSFKNLLERELDAVEVEESRRPLEDTPMDLHLGGWKRGGGGSGGIGGDNDDGVGREPSWLSSLLKREDGDATGEPAPVEESADEGGPPSEDEEAGEPSAEEAEVGGEEDEVEKDD